jgi:hypothetical protein
MPFKTFANGAILTDVDLNDYLMEQTVISCTSGTRPASPNEGMLIYETDTDRYVSYNGGWLTFGQNITSTYTATLTASTTNPNLGTGGAAEGRYTLFNGKWCTVRGTIFFGTGATAGSGQYLVALPFQSSASISNGVSHVGSMMCRDTSAVVLGFGTCYISANALNMAFYVRTSSVEGTMNSGAPFAWASTDYISFDITYEIA